jgi:3-oxoacyl-[acyl-carrier-protein] synthase-3
VFADGAGAALVSSTDGAASRIGPIVLHADHEDADLIRLNRGERIQMRGPDTFRAAVARLTEVTGEALERAGIGIDDIELFVYHQANSRIIRAVGERLRLPAERVLDYVDRFANASTATLPIALSVAQSEGRLRVGDRVLLATFGGGLTWGGTVVQWSAQLGDGATQLDARSGDAGAGQAVRENAQTAALSAPPDPPR